VSKRNASPSHPIPSHPIQRCDSGTSSGQAGCNRRVVRGCVVLAAATDGPGVVSGLQLHRGRLSRSGGSKAAENTAATSDERLPPELQTPTSTNRKKNEKINGLQVRKDLLEKKIIILGDMKIDDVVMELVSETPSAAPGKIIGKVSAESLKAGFMDGAGKQVNTFDEEGGTYKVYDVVNVEDAGFVGFVGMFYDDSLYGFDVVYKKTESKNTIYLQNDGNRFTRQYWPTKTKKVGLKYGIKYYDSMKTFMDDENFKTVT